MEGCRKQSPEDRPTFAEINRNRRGLIGQNNSDNYISMLDLSEVPTKSTDTLETEGTL